MKNTLKRLAIELLRGKKIKRLNEEIRISSKLAELFAEMPEITVVQVGANGFTLDDPIDQYLTDHKGWIYLIEPVEYCCEELKRKYAGKSNISVINTLITKDTDQLLDFFYVEYSDAMEMSSYGARNNWAMGQGSLSRATVEMWIEQNAFRGHEYRRNIQRYRDNIVCKKLKGQSLASIFAGNNISQFCILVVDVQGAELDVLTSLEKSPAMPNIILYESDSSTDNSIKEGIENWRVSNGYIHIGGANDILLLRVKHHK
jgi:FkbM family methyltransferase